MTRWKNLDTAMADPLFQSLRGVMGTASYGQDDALFRVLSHFEAATQPSPAAPATAEDAVSDEAILALNSGERFFSESPSKYPEAGFGTQYHAGAPGVIGFARAILALRSGASAQPADTARLDWLDETNKRFRMGWQVGVAPAGNCSVKAIIMGGKPIREAIDAAIAKEQPHDR